MMAWIDLPTLVATFVPRTFPETIVVRDVTYFQKLDKLMEDTSMEVLQAYFIAQTAFILSDYLDPETTPHKIVTTFRDRTHKAVPDSDLAREFFCISEIRQNLGYLIGFFFVNETSGT